MKDKTRKILIVILTCALAVCLFMVVRSYILETQGDEIYSDAVDEFLSMADPTDPPQTTLPDDTTAPASTTTGTEAQTTEADTTAAPTTEKVPTQTKPPVKNPEDMIVDFDKLLAVNPDIVGWIAMENTYISYPLLQGSDNEKYLTTTYNNKYSKYGSIFLDYRLDSTFDIPHTVIYGHNMRNSSMFGTLLKFSTKSYWQSRKYFHILLPGGVLKYEIFSAYKADINSDTYQIGFADAEAKEAWIANLISYSDVNMGVTPTADDIFVTLSTCTSNSSEREDKRYVVHGRLVYDSRDIIMPTAPAVTE